MSGFEDFVQTELPKRPFTESDGAPGDIPVRSTNALAARELVWLPPSALGLGGTSLVAAGAISGHRVIATTPDGRARYSSSADVADAQSAIGISSNAAADGGNVSVRFGGVMTEPTWSWTPGLPIFCGVDGVLSQSSPTSGFSLVVATVIDATTILVDIKQPIILN